MNRGHVLVLGGLAAMAACTQANQARPAGPTPSTRAESTARGARGTGAAQAGAAASKAATSLAVGTTFTARIDQTLGVLASRDGEEFTATVYTPLYNSDSLLVVPKGSVVYGHIARVHDANAGQPALIEIVFDNLVFNNRSFALHGAVASVDVEKPWTGSPESVAAREAVAPPAQGTALGGLLSGAELSKLAAADTLKVTGSVVSLGAGGPKAEIPSGSTLTIRVTRATSLK